MHKEMLQVIAESKAAVAEASRYLAALSRVVRGKAVGDGGLVGLAAIDSGEQSPLSGGHQAEDGGASLVDAVAAWQVTLAVLRKVEAMVSNMKESGVIEEKEAHLLLEELTHDEERLQRGRVAQFLAERPAPPKPGEWGRALDALETINAQARKVTRFGSVDQVGADSSQTSLGSTFLRLVRVHYRHDDESKVQRTTEFSDKGVAASRRSSESTSTRRRRRQQGEGSGSPWHRKLLQSLQRRRNEPPSMGAGIEVRERARKAKSEPAKSTAHPLGNKNLSVTADSSGGVI